MSKLHKLVIALVVPLALTGCGFGDSDNSTNDTYNSTMTADRVERNFKRCMDNAVTSQDVSTCNIILHKDSRELNNQ